MSDLPQHLSADERVAYWSKIFSLFAASITVAVLRFFVRIKSDGWRNLARDDFFMFIAMLAATVEIVLSSFMTMNRSLNRIEPYQADLIPDELKVELIKGAKSRFKHWIVYESVMYCLKAVAICFFHRITHGVPKEERRVKVIGGITGVSYIAGILTHILQCLPVTRSWQIIPYPGPYCAKRPLNPWVHGALNVLTDLLCAAMPIPMVINLHTSRQRKVILILIFCSALGVVMAGIWRNYWIYHNSQESEIWTSVEIFVTTISVSAPCLKYLRTRQCWRPKREMELMPTTPQQPIVMSPINTADDMDVGTLGDHQTKVGDSANDSSVSLVAILKSPMSVETKKSEIGVTLPEWRLSGPWSTDAGTETRTEPAADSADHSKTSQACVRVRDREASSSPGHTR